VSFPPFIRSVDPDDEAARLAAARKDSEARYTTATASCRANCGLSGNAEGALYIAQLAGQAAQHAAATGHVVTVEIAPKAAEPGDG
jgi:hypothetical protein